MKMNLKKSIIYGINSVVFAWITVPYTFTISIDQLSLNLNNWLALLFLLFFTTVILGTPLFILHSIIIAVLDGNSNLLDSDNLDLSRTGLKTVGCATAYTMILYILGLSDCYFSFVF